VLTSKLLTMVVREVIQEDMSNDRIVKTILGTFPLMDLDTLYHSANQQNSFSHPFNPSIFIHITAVLCSNNSKSEDFDAISSELSEAQKYEKSYVAWLEFLAAITSEERYRNSALHVKDYVETAVTEYLNDKSQQM
jgi:hypothetical protein